MLRQWNLIARFIFAVALGSGTTSSSGTSRFWSKANDKVQMDQVVLKTEFHPSCFVVMLGGGAFIPCVQGFYSICLLVDTHGNFSWPIHMKRKLSLG